MDLVETYPPIMVIDSIIVQVKMVAECELVDVSETIITLAPPHELI